MNKDAILFTDKTSKTTRIELGLDIKFVMKTVIKLMVMFNILHTFVLFFSIAEFIRSPFV